MNLRIAIALILSAQFSFRSAALEATSPCPQQFKLLSQLNAGPFPPQQVSPRLRNALIQSADRHYSQMVKRLTPDQRKTLEEFVENISYDSSGSSHMRVLSIDRTPIDISMDATITHMPLNLAYLLHEIQHLSDAFTHPQIFRQSGSNWNRMRRLETRAFIRHRAFLLDVIRSLGVSDFSKEVSKTFQLSDEATVLVERAIRAIIEPGPIKIHPDERAAIESMLSGLEHQSRIKIKHLFRTIHEINDRRRFTADAVDQLYRPDFEADEKLKREADRLDSKSDVEFVKVFTLVAAAIAGATYSIRSSEVENKTPSP